MPDRARPIHPSRARAASGRAPPPDTPPGKVSPWVVVGALLRGQPELRLLLEAVAGMATLELVDDRFALLSTVLTCRPGAVVVPPFDVDHTSTAPLVLRVRREAPGVAVLVLSSHPAGAGQPMLRAVQAGADAVTSPTADELRAALSSLLESGPPGP